MHLDILCLSSTPAEGARHRAACSHVSFGMRLLTAAPCRAALNLLMAAEEAEVKAVVKIDPAVARRAMMDNSARAASGAGASTSAAGASAANRGAASGGGALTSQLWVEKHKPRDSRELVGNQATIEWLRVFLRNWWAPLPPLQHPLSHMTAVHVQVVHTRI